MTKTVAVMRYKAAVSVFSKWLSNGIISGDEFNIIDTMIASKYGLSLCSIYRENRLLCQETRANMA